MHRAAYDRGFSFAYIIYDWVEIHPPCMPKRRRRGRRAPKCSLRRRSLLPVADESYRRSPESERSRRSVVGGQRGDPEEKENEKDKSKRENEEKSL